MEPHPKKHLRQQQESPKRLVKGAIQGVTNQGAKKSTLMGLHLPHLLHLYPVAKLTIKLITSVKVNLTGSKISRWI